MATYCIGLTGGIASGKTAVTRAFEALGIFVADADIAARDAVAPGSPGLSEIVASFGHDVLDAEGKLDRAAMRKRVFDDADARRQLEGIIHPRVRELLIRQCEVATSPYAIAAIPLLAEVGGRAIYPWLQRILVVDVPVETQRQRLIQRDGIDVALLAHGTLPDQAACEADAGLALREFDTNATSTIALLTVLAQRLQDRRGATLAAISSVAGDRGRASNYLYGAAKAAVSAFLSGLRQRLTPAGVNVLTIKPGFVDTPMTREFKKGALWAKPDAVARGILRAVDKRRGVAYLPFFWWGVMTIIKHIPEFVFRRVKL